MSRLSLRARLVLGVLALATVGLVAADAVTYASLRSFLLTRVDRTLEDDHRAVERQIGHGDDDRSFGGAPGLFLQVQTRTGEVVVRGEVPHIVGTDAPSPPKLPGTIDVPQASGGPGGPDDGRYFTVRATQGSERYRVRASALPGTSLVLVLASSLHDVDTTLHRLLLIELFVTLGVLAAIVVLGLWIVRLGLRPLAAIGRTTDRITGGDLSQRVERAEPRTEVGRLGLALNAMLDRIEASDRRLRRFVADASHELRTPLAAVSAYAELFGRGADRRPDDLRRAMAGISRESDRMKELVEDLLLLARLDEGRPLEREPVELDTVAAEAVETARALEPGRPIELHVETAVVLGDRARLRRLLDNLLGNVRSHTPPETPAHVRVSSVNGSAILEVADDGPGLPPEEQRRVFERFYRTDASRSRESGGVGLGLSIVAAIAEAHHGHATVTAAPGAGATFRVELPLAGADAAPSADAR